MQVGEHRIVTLEEALGCVELPVMVDFTLADVVEPALDGDSRRRSARPRPLLGRERRRSPPGACSSRRPRGSRSPGPTRESPPATLLEELGIEYFNPPWELLDAQVVESMHDRGYKVSTWTVDDPRVMRRVVDCGADAVVTNRVRELVPLLAEARC